MGDFSRFGDFTSGTSTRKLRAFIRELTPRSGSFTRSAKRLGFFFTYYFITMAVTVIGLGFIGVLSLAVPIIAIPFAFWLSYRIAQATARAEETNGDHKK